MTSNERSPFRCTLVHVPPAMKDRACGLLKDQMRRLDQKDQVYNQTHLYVFNYIRNMFKAFHEAVNEELLQSCLKITLTDLETFSRTLTSAHANVRLSAIHFGNLEMHNLLSHWEVSFTSKEKNSLSADFFHDARALHVKFENIEKLTKQKTVTAFYEIKVLYSSIRRIIVDLESSRLHFFISAPVSLRKVMPSGAKKRFTVIHRGRHSGEKSSEAVLTENDTFSLEFDRIEDRTLFELLSRLRAQCTGSIEFRKLKIIHHLDFSTRNWNTAWGGVFNANEKKEQKLLERRLDALPISNHREQLQYLIEALLSRGSLVKYQLFGHDGGTWSQFLTDVIDVFKSFQKCCIEALLRTLQHFDEHRGAMRIRSHFFSVVVELIKSKEEFGITAEQRENGFHLVRKVVVTPTRVLILAPEMLVGNRVLRGPRNIDPADVALMRVSFRDDNIDLLRPSNLCSPILRSTVARPFDNGITVAGRQYLFLGNSSSHSRSQGAHFGLGITNEHRKEWKKMYSQMEQPFDYSIQHTRMKLGNFLNLGCSSKQMARIGQCFTQSIDSKIVLHEDDYEIIPDCEGGKNPKGEPYIFTDGCGSISPEFARQIAENMNLKSVPSCFQFRYIGAKGVLCVDANLGERGDWSVDQQATLTRKIKFQLRNSQIKFLGNHQESLEVVKVSSPNEVCLNKPLINILDQVSEKQSLACHKLILNGIRSLLDEQLEGLTASLISEEKCRNKIRGMPRLIDISCLDQRFGFQLVNEPFFRSLLKTAVRCEINKLVGKLQIQLPAKSGRMMLGVTDISGRLQYGQVFVRYTRDVTHNSPRPNAAKITLLGPVMVTKSPSVVMGDVRMFEAVDIPELHHLVDVIVFPQHGPRPHPDEMAGSDLDGDEYSVIWDKRLRFEKNEEAIHFEKAKPPERTIQTAYKHPKLLPPLKKEIMTAGTFAEAYANFALILERIFHYFAYARVTPKWNDTLKSVGKLQRQFEEAKQGEDERTQRRLVAEVNLKMGKMLETLREVEAWLKMNDEFRDSFSNYIENDRLGQISVAHLITSDLYGLEAEVSMSLAHKASQAVDFPKTGIPPAQVRNGWTTVRNKELPPEQPERYPDFAQKDYKPFYISQRLNGKLYREVKQVGEWLYESDENCKTEELKIDEKLRFPGYEEVMQTATTTLRRYNSQLQRIMQCYGIKTEAELFSGHILEVKNKADVDLDANSNFNSLHTIKHRVTDLFSSFRKDFFEEFGGWLTMTAAPQDNQYEMNVCKRKCDKIWDSLKRKASAYYVACYETAAQVSVEEERFLSFAWLASDVLADVRRTTTIDDSDFGIREHPLVLQIRSVLESYKRVDVGLSTQSALNEFLDEWWTSAQIPKGNPFGVEQLCNLLQLFAKSPNRKNIFGRHIEPVEFNEYPYPEELLISFIDYLASSEFRELTHISFAPIGISSVFRRGEWKPIHEAAKQSFFNMVFELSLDVLPNSLIRIPRKREFTPFVIEMPGNYVLSKVEKRLKQLSGLTAVKLRKFGNQKTVWVLSYGSLTAYNKLRSLVGIKVTPKAAPMTKARSAQLAVDMWKNIMQY